ncbi:hypothetical protein NW072_04610 [Mycoplasmopsis felis]|uniref:hypothetical protein n=1 Tax=Mycoplasmopsis felis TaxID=33923 RepID=UPI0021B0563B|nr:hypothetical protein [Mycoplasmopsis felis]UWV79311.1 hypothetical protein NW072_04610 [Mycoplasmopsis felis]
MINFLIKPGCPAPNLPISVLIYSRFFIVTNANWVSKVDNGLFSSASFRFATCSLIDCFNFSISAK